MTGRNNNLFLSSNSFAVGTNDVINYSAPGELAAKRTFRNNVCTFNPVTGESAANIVALANNLVGGGNECTVGTTCRAAVCTGNNRMCNKICLGRSDGVAYLTRSGNVATFGNGAIVNKASNMCPDRIS